jgi:hypothetical protein
LPVLKFDAIIPIAVPRNLPENLHLLSFCFPDGKDEKLYIKDRYYGKGREPLLESRGREMHYIEKSK